jgi:hypothetical protein
VRCGDWPDGYRFVNCCTTPSAGSTSKSTGITRPEVLVSDVDFTLPDLPTSAAVTAYGIGFVGWQMPAPHNDLAPVGALPKALCRAAGSGRTRQRSPCRTNDQCGGAGPEGSSAHRLTP